MDLYNDMWDDAQIESLARTLKAIAHPSRVAIIAMLANGKRMTVTEIYSRLNADQSSVSHHLSILRDRHVLVTNRQGKFIYYSLKSEIFISLLVSLSASPMDKGTNGKQGGGTPPNFLNNISVAGQGNSFKGTMN